MKTIISAIAILLFTGLGASAQSITKYDTCSYKRQYEGEWEYANGSDTIRVYLRYHQYKRLSGYTRKY